MLTARRKMQRNQIKAIRKKQRMDHRSRNGINILIYYSLVMIFYDIILREI